MTINKSIIFVDRGATFSNLSVVNAYSLCTSVTDETHLVWNSSQDIPIEIKELIKKGKIVLSDGSQKTSESDFDLLEQTSLDSEVLIVSAGSTETVNHYFHKRLKRENATKARWNFLSAEYARYALLDRQRLLSDFIPVDTTNWLRQLLLKYSELEIIKSLERVSEIETVLIGESIIDEYVYCDALGKVSKDPLVAFHRKEVARQAGGVLATGKHFAGLGSKVYILSEIGEEEERFVVGNLATLPNISHQFLKNFSSIVKTRYVDRSSNARVFETYSLPANYSNVFFGDLLKSFFSISSNKVLNYVLMDYGHGMFDNKNIEFLMNSGLDLSVNAQSNAGNRGYTSIARYKGAHRVFLNGSEVLLETRDRESDLVSLVSRLAAKLEINELFVTNGSRGIICFSKDEGFFVSPAFAPTIVDRTGAGDATLATISALRSAQVPSDIATFFGNISGALLVSTVGNEVTLSLESLREEAISILRKVNQLYV